MHPSFNLLGFKVRDVVTNIEGFCDSICFDLYGCIQAAVRPDGFNDKGEPKSAHWYDIKRLVKISDHPIIPVPNFSMPEIGAADKPAR